MVDLIKVRGQGYWVTYGKYGKCFHTREETDNGIGRKQFSEKVWWEDKEKTLSILQNEEF